jgi:hypothetical protein
LQPTGLTPSKIDGLKNQVGTEIVPATPARQR